MNTRAYHSIDHHLLLPLLIVAMLALGARRSYAQPGSEKKIPTFVWVNSFYGRNNVGVGLATRYSAIGIGATVFSFIGDTTVGLKPRPGITGFTVDLYLAGDLNGWLAIYGNIGAMGRLATYKTYGDNSPFPNSSLMSLGGGFQLSLLSHLVLGIGYNSMMHITEHTEDQSYDSIQSIVAQVGYRL